MTERLCACNCGTSLKGMRANALYATHACQERARKARRAEEAQHAQEPSLRPPTDPAVVLNHPYEPRDSAVPWGLCGCGLSEAAHAQTVKSYAVIA